jgi:hypothetical protein
MITRPTYLGPLIGWRGPQETVPDLSKVDADVRDSVNNWMGKGYSFADMRNRIAESVFEPVGKGWFRLQGGPEMITRFGVKPFRINPHDPNFIKAMMLYKKAGMPINIPKMNTGMPDIFSADTWKRGLSALANNDIIQKGLQVAGYIPGLSGLSTAVQTGLDLSAAFLPPSDPAANDGLVGGSVRRRRRKRRLRGGVIGDGDDMDVDGEEDAPADMDVDEEAAPPRIPTPPPPPAGPIIEEFDAPPEVPPPVNRTEFWRSEPALRRLRIDLVGHRQEGNRIGDEIIRGSLDDALSLLGRLFSQGMITLSGFRDVRDALIQRQREENPSPPYNPTSPGRPDDEIVDSTAPQIYEPAGVPPALRYGTNNDQASSVSAAAPRAGSYSAYGTPAARPTVQEVVASPVVTDTFGRMRRTIMDTREGERKEELERIFSNAEIAFELGDIEGALAAARDLNNLTNWRISASLIDYLRELKALNPSSDEWRDYQRPSSGVHPFEVQTQGGRPVNIRTDSTPFQHNTIPAVFTEPAPFEAIAEREGNTARRTVLQQGISTTFSNAKDDPRDADFLSHAFPRRGQEQAMDESTNLGPADAVGIAPAAPAAKKVEVEIVPEGYDNRYAGQTHVERPLFKVPSLRELVMGADDVDFAIASHPNLGEREKMAKMLKEEAQKRIDEHDLDPAKQQKKLDDLARSRGVAMRDFQGSRYYDWMGRRWPADDDHARHAAADALGLASDTIGDTKAEYEQRRDLMRSMNSDRQVMQDPLRMSSSATTMLRIIEAQNRYLAQQQAAAREAARKAAEANMEIQSLGLFPNAPPEPPTTGPAGVPLLLTDAAQVAREAEKARRLPVDAREARLRKYRRPGKDDEEENPSKRKKGSGVRHKRVRY